MTFEEIKKLYFHVISEKTITTKNGMGLIFNDNFQDFIHYRHYGQSAIKGDLESFEWLINTIYKDYHFNDFILNEKNIYDFILDN